MPILDVELVSNEPPLASLARCIADAAAEIFRSEPSTTWVRIRTLPPSQYAENETDQPNGWNSVFISILKHRRPEGEALETEVRALTISIAALCKRPAENIHIKYEPDAAGRIAFGGTLHK